MDHAFWSMGIGLSKSGFPGVSMFHMVVFATIFGSKESTGILLPMLVVGDCVAIFVFGRKAVWAQVRRLLPPTLAGVILGWQLMGWLENPAIFERLVGTIILADPSQVTRSKKTRSGLITYPKKNGLPSCSDC